MYTGKKDRVAAVFSYLGWVFWIVALIIRNRDDRLSGHHLNQGFVLAIAGTITGLMMRFHGVLRFAGSVLGLGVLALTVMGIARAVRGSDEPLPVVGEIKLL